MNGFHLILHFGIGKLFLLSGCFSAVIGTASQTQTTKVKIAVSNYTNRVTKASPAVEMETLAWCHLVST